MYICLSMYAVQKEKIENRIMHYAAVYFSDKCKHAKTAK